MKSGIVLVSIAAMGLRLCGGSDASVVAAPLHGGTIVMAGDKSIEVIAKADGAVEAWVPDVAAGAQLTVHVRGADGQPHPVVMHESGSGSFTGTLVGVAPAPGPIEVVLVSGGTTLRGNVDAFAIVAVQGVDVAVAVDVVVPRPVHGGLVVAVEGQPVEVVAKSGGEIEAFFVGEAAGGLVIQPAQAEVLVHVRGSDLQMHPVTLRWDAATASYKGELTGDLQVVPGPMEVVITWEGRARRASTQLATVVIGGGVDVAVRGPAARVRSRTGNVRVVGGAGSGVVVGGGGAGGVVIVGGSLPPPPSVHIDVQIPRPPPPPRVRASGSVGVSAGGGVQLGN